MPDNGNTEDHETESERMLDQRFVFKLHFNIKYLISVDYLFMSLVLVSFCL